jgi:hypothetical protein
MNSFASFSNITWRANVISHDAGITTCMPCPSIRVVYIDERTIEILDDLLQEDCRQRFCCSRIVSCLKPCSVVLCQANSRQENRSYEQTAYMQSLDSPCVESTVPVWSLQSLYRFYNPCIESPSCLPPASSCSGTLQAFSYSSAVVACCPKVPRWRSLKSMHPSMSKKCARRIMSCIFSSGSVVPLF